jgi:hypothetical protein
VLNKRSLRGGIKNVKKGREVGRVSVASYIVPKSLEKSQHSPLSRLSGGK